MSVAVSVLPLFFAVTWAGLRSVIVKFPGHTHFLLAYVMNKKDYIVLMF